MPGTARLLAFVAGCGILGTGLPSYAATGLAWDQVTRFSMDGSTPQPNFAADFQVASQPAQAQTQRGGMFGGITNAMNAAMGAMQMMKTGIAERHFVAGSFERTDNVAQQTATITDCAARTITTLNLAKKTYRVVSMDRAQTPPSVGKPGPQAPAPAATPDDTRYKISYASQALGPKQIDGVNTDGYSAVMTITVMRPNTDPQTINTNLTEYISTYAQPQQSCPSRLAMGGDAGGAGAMGAMSANMNMTHMINAAMRTPGGDPRFTFSSSGPALPSGRLDLFSVYQFAGQQGGGRGFATIIERGNVHQVGDGDKSIFGIPPDFTQET